MQLTGTFVLPEDAILQPVVELSEEFRRLSGSESSDFALTRKNSRSLSKVIDADAAALLRNFEKPSTIAMAIARFSRSQGGDPEQALEDALPMLRALISDGLLVGESSEYRISTSASLTVGADIAGWQVVRSIQALEDTEVYQVRDSTGRWGALKVCRPGNRSARHALPREAQILNSVSAACAPRLLASGDSPQGPYVITEWARGVNAEWAAGECRFEPGSESRVRLHKLCGVILTAYAELHEAGVIHGDIHASNVLVDGHQTVKIVDLGVARNADDALEMTAASRAGVSFFFEPEYAQAALDGEMPPAASFAGEQYSLAALLYLLLTGSHVQDYSLERKEMLRQIATGAMVSFKQRGMEPWPEIEHVLARALNKDAKNRFRSVREFAAAWHAVEFPALLAATGTKPPSQSGEICREVLLKSIIPAADTTGELWWHTAFAVPPCASINHGRAGVAYALYRIASSSGDGQLLAVADAWSAKALRDVDSPAAFRNEAFGLTAKVGRTSFHHGPAGLYAVQAIIAAAQGDIDLQHRAIAGFLDWNEKTLMAADLEVSDLEVDLTLGLAGHLLGSAFILDAMGDGILPRSVAHQKAALLNFGRRLHERIWSFLDGLAPAGDSSGLADLGVAHGWAGILYASLCWCTAAGEPVSASLQRRLLELADCAEPRDRGFHWLYGNRMAIPGWCNGSAGFVFLWTEAYKALGDPRYSELAEGAAWSTWELSPDHGSLCCGLGGQAYALLNFYRHSGETAWLTRAKKLAQLAAEAQTLAAAKRSPDDLDTRPESLYKGKLGIAVLETELEFPGEARMPFFERE